MDNLGANPFAVLSFIVAPAVLTNASCILTMATSNRFARAIDRVRTLSSLLSTAGAVDPAERPLRLRQMHYAERRTLLLVRAMSAFNVSVGSFALAAFTSLLGAVFHAVQQEWLRQGALVTAIGGGVSGVGGLVWGSGLLFYEARSTLRILSEETRFILERLHRAEPKKADGA